MRKMIKDLVNISRTSDVGVTDVSETGKEIVNIKEQ